MAAAPKAMSVDEVCVWLKTLHLEKHAAKFKANEVDGVLLMALGEAELKADLGVESGLEAKKIIANRALLPKGPGGSAGSGGDGKDQKSGAAAEAPKVSCATCFGTKKQVCSTCSGTGSKGGLTCKECGKA